MKTDLLQVRVQPEEKQAFQEVAELAGMSLSAWIRASLRRCAIKELEDASRPIRFLGRQRDGKAA